MTRERFACKKWYILFLNIYLVCLPLGAINIGAIGSALKLIAILPISIAFLGGTKIKITSPLMAQILFTFFAFVSSLWSISLSRSVERSISYILLLALLLSTTAFSYTKEDAKKIKQALVWSSRFTAIIVFLFADYIEGRLGLKNEVISEDPNYMCAYFVFGLVYSLSVMLSKNSIKFKVLASIEMIIYLFIVLSTGSRGGLLAVLAALVMCFLTGGEKGRKIDIKKILYVFITCVLIVVIINYLPDTLRDRFTIQDVVETGGTGRTTLWKQTIDVFWNGNILRNLFGFGTASITTCFRQFHYPVVNVTHNIFLETLAELGIIGFVLYSSAIFLFVQNSYKNKDKFAFAIICGMIVLSLSTSIFTFKPYFNIMAYILILNNTEANEVAMV